MEKSKNPICYCEFCHAHIPLSSALTPEGKDYVFHFCGPACFEKWEKNKPEEKK